MDVLALSKDDERIAFKETWCCRRQYDKSLKEDADVCIDETESMAYEKESMVLVDQNENDGRRITYMSVGGRIEMKEVKFGDDKWCRRSCGQRNPNVNDRD